MGTFITIILAKIIYIFYVLTYYYMHIDSLLKGSSIEIISILCLCVYSFYLVLFLALFCRFHYLAKNNHHLEYKERRFQVILYSMSTSTFYALLILVHIFRFILLTNEKDSDRPIYWQIYYIRIKINVI